MDIQVLTHLFHDLESDRIERKASLTSTAKEKICQAVCAFANDLPNHQQPGVLFIGQHDNGSCADIDITDNILKNLSQIREQVLPFPTMSVEKHVIDGCEVVVIIVEPSNSPPVHFKGRIWIRVGPRRAIASREEENRLSEKRRFKDAPYDIYPISVNNPPLEVGGLQEQSYRLQVDQTQHFLSATLP